MNRLLRYNQAPSPLAARGTLVRERLLRGASCVRARLGLTAMREGSQKLHSHERLPLINQSSGRVDEWTSASGPAGRSVIRYLPARCKSYYRDCRLNYTSYTADCRLQPYNCTEQSTILILILIFRPTTRLAIDIHTLLCSVSQSHIHAQRLELLPRMLLRLFRSVKIAQRPIPNRTSSLRYTTSQGGDGAHAL